MRTCIKIATGLVIIYFILLSCLCLSGCSTTTYIGDTVPQYKYGEECFEKPYSNKYGDSYLCQANAISKLNQQVEIHNEMLK